MRAVALALVLAAVPVFPAEPHMRDHMDERLIVMSKVERFEYSAAGKSLLAWDADFRAGHDFNKLLLRTEGQMVAGNAEEAELEAFWARPVARWWDLVAGVRQEVQPAESRSWLAVGAEGIAPYQLHIQATGYVGEQWRTAMRLEAGYELLLTNRLILQPRMELNAFGKSDPDRGIGSGVSDFELGLRLRYEVRREVAPYLGVVWANKLGNTADMATANGQDAHEVRAIVGLRVWY